MHPRILAEQEQIASARLHKAASRLSEKLGLAGQALDLDSIRRRNTRVQTLRRNEMLADFLEEVDQRLEVAGEAVTEREVIERVLGLKDLTKTSAEAIRSEFADILEDEPTDEGEE